MCRVSVVYLFYSVSLIGLMTLAGMPPTIVLSGTSLVTSAPAAIIEFSPTVIPGKMVAPAPIQAFFLMRIELRTRDFRCVGITG